VEFLTEQRCSIEERSSCRRGMGHFQTVLEDPSVTVWKYWRRFLFAS